MKKAKILHETQYEIDRFKITKAEIELERGKGKTAHFQRSKIEREDAAAVVLYDKSKDVFHFIRQFRYPVEGRTKSYLLELVAGKIDKAGEDPIKTAIRETEEEAGFVVPKKNMRLLCSFFASPGYTTEKYHLFLAQVSEEDRKTKGGGLEAENEYISMESLSRKDYFERCNKGEIEDAKTLLAGLWLQQMQTF
jgi:ADP-ribose pyrophosphatase